MLKPERPGKPPVDPALKRRIEELIRFKGGGHNEESVADIIENALKLLTDVKDSGDVRVIQDASAKQKHRGRDELLGWYRKGIGIELIEDDLLTWLRASSSRAAA